ncbi:MAG: hypothetical protein U0821_27640 [Chloroflexota bacterium]
MRRIVLSLLGAWLCLTLTAGAAVAGDDPCPEPNDATQAACYLGDADALGFLSRANDVDAYRIDVLDFGARLRVALVDTSPGYRITLVNWNGDIMAVSNRQGAVDVLEATPPAPGAYFALVDSRTGEFSDGRPYRLHREVAYRGQPPVVVFSGDFRPGARENLTESGENADFITDSGRVTIKMKQSGTPEDGSPTPGLIMDPEVPPVGDFTLVVDTKLKDGDQGGYLIFFKVAADYATNDDHDHYRLVVAPRDHAMKLVRIANGVDEILEDGIEDELITADKVNRMVIRCSGSDIRLNVNGKELARVKDDVLREGRVGFGTITWGDPSTVVFDNLLVVTPARR